MAGPKIKGRPPHSQLEFDIARPRILQALQTVGFRRGKGTIGRMLPDIPRRLASRILKGLKAQHRADEAAMLRKNRIHVEVLAIGAVLAQDSTHTGHAKGKKVFAEAFKDAASLEAWAEGDGKPVTGKAMIGHLERLKSQGRLPLVLATDNGSAYKEKGVQEWLHANQVVHLFSRPHTPTDNGRAERAIGEGKALAGLGRGVKLQSGEQGVAALQKAFQALNTHLPRSSKKGKTAETLKRILPHWRKNTIRSSFFEATCSAVRGLCSTTKRARREETREAIFRTLELFGLILRTRGEQKIGYVKQDRIS